MSEQQSQKTNIGPLVLSAIFLIVVTLLVFMPRDVVSTKLSANVFEGFSFTHSIFEDIVLEADVSYIADIETGKIVYQKNADIVRPLASLTKIMTAYAALEVFPEGSTVQIQESDLSGAGDHGLVPGEVWKLENLLAFMLVTSSNDAAIAVGRVGEGFVEEESFAQYMTELSRELGYETLNFENTSGLDIDEAETIPGALGSAEDISQMFMRAYEKYPEVFNPTKDFLVTLESDTEVHNIENTNIALNQMPGIVGSKTGYTQTAGGNLSVVTQINNKPHVVTVLQSSREGRFQDVSEIINIIQKNND
jgi:D-alanyl-D-alanine carboxypeptidase (penicillin-binding protein 5/6)